MVSLNIKANTSRNKCFYLVALFEGSRFYFPVVTQCNAVCRALDLDNATRQSVA